LTMQSKANILPYHPISDDKRTPNKTSISLHPVKTTVPTNKESDLHRRIPHKVNGNGPKCLPKSKLEKNSYF
jgi:hypothetical protein